MKKALLLVATPLILLAQSYSLPQLIAKAEQYHQQLKAKALEIKSANSQIEAARSNFYPTIDISANYTGISPNSVVSPGDTTTGTIAISYDIYDGGRKNAVLTANQFEHQATQFERDAFAKSIVLEITNSYYGIFKIRANLYALTEQSKELTAQINRIRKFYENGLATQEEIDKLLAVYENNQYLIANAQLQLITEIENIRLATGVKVDQLKENVYKEPNGIIYESYEISKIISTKAKVVEESAKAIDAGYLPQVVISDSYRKSSYGDVVSSGFGDGLLAEEDNRVNLSARMRIFDNGKMKKDSEALQYQKMALESDALYASEEQKMQYRLAKSRMQTIINKRKSTQSALKASRSTYDAIVKKFDAGAVDNITYLDALNKLTLTQAIDKETQYDYEIAKSIYYFYAGKNPKEFIK